MRRNIKFIIIIFIVVIFMWILSCTQVEYDNPLNPASENYISESAEKDRVIITNFEGDSTLSVWGLLHDEFGIHGGTIIKSFTTQRTLNGKMSRVMQLDFEASDSSFSGGTWHQFLGYGGPKYGTFNAMTMGLKFLSFMAQSNAGEIKMGVSFSDINENTTDPTFDVTVTNRWEKIRIPIGQLASGSVDLKVLTNLNMHLGEFNKKGRVFIDDIAFEWE